MTNANQPPALPEWPARLRDMLTEYFSLDDLAMLCLDIRVDFDELGEGPKSRRVVRLIKLMAENGRLPSLLDRCAQLRPNLDWVTVREKAETNPELFQFSDSTDDNILNLLHQIADQTLVADSVAQNIETAPPEPGDPPYLGLQYFTEADADQFFGRELLTAHLINRLHDTRFLAVIGASGSGKSSLVRAGIIPALRQGQALADGSQPPVNSSQWTICMMTPSAHPLDALAAVLTQDSESVTAVIDMQSALSQNKRALTLATQQILTRTSTPHLLLVIDQFEEIFTLCRQPEERKAFIDNLVTGTAPEDNQPLTILITLRADFYAQCAQDDNLRRLVSQQQEYIGAMNREELARAIVQPAALGDWRIQEGLVEQMLDDVGDEPGALPLLSHALLETWGRRRGRTMTLSGYRESGGVRGAIAQTAESIFQQRLTPAQQAIARMIFVRLTELGESVDGETPDTRRRAAFSELITRTTDPEMLDAVLAILTQSRLITTDLLPPDETKVVEVSHEALIREWPTLRQWLDQDRENLIHQRQLTDDVNDWLKLDRDTGALYRGIRLQQMQAWAKSFPEPLSAEEQAFLDASQAAVQAEAEQEARLAHSQRIQRIMLGVVALLLLGLIVGGIYIMNNGVGTVSQLGTPTPCLPQTMPGDFNVAVAEFVVLDETGNIDSNSQAGKQIANRVESQLQTAFAEDESIAVWADSEALQQQFCAEIGSAGDNLVGVPSPEEIAEKVKADVVVYGILRPVADQGELQLQFYVTPQFGLNTGNLLGTYNFETAVPIFDITDPGNEGDAVLGAQTEALARMARGFSNEMLGRQEEALADFEQAAAAVPKSDFAHYFVGQENLFIAQDKDTVQSAPFLDNATTAFEQAPDNARAQIGLSAVAFVQAQQAFNEVLRGEADGDPADLLASVAAKAQQALDGANGVIANGSQVETYGVPVDQIARVVAGISLRLLGEVAFELGDTGQAMALMVEAGAELETAVSALSSINDHRLQAQVYQALGSVYEWQLFLFDTQGNRDEKEIAKQKAIENYEQCVTIGESFPFDVYTVDEIVTPLCAERLPLLAAQ